MALSATRGRALNLYRRLLRSARKWPGPEEEKEYIRDETRKLFRKNRDAADREAIEKQLFEGETRMEIGWHYLIPYPRPHNLPPGTVPGQMAKTPSTHMGTLHDEEEDEEVPVLKARNRHWQDH